MEEEALKLLQEEGQPGSLLDAGLWGTRQSKPFWGFGPPLWKKNQLSLSCYDYALQTLL